MPSSASPDSSSFIPDSTTVTSPTQNGAHLSHSMTSEPIHDGIVGDSPRSDNHVGSKIAETKLKAKTLLNNSQPVAESNSLEVHPLSKINSPDEPRQEQDFSVAPKTNGAHSTISNGTSGSRKRSRSGSPIESRPSRKSTEDLLDMSRSLRPSIDEILLEQFVTREHLQSAAHFDQEAKARSIIANKRSEVEQYQVLLRERQTRPVYPYGYGYAGFGNGHTDGPSTILYPADHKRPGNKRTRPLRMPRKEMETQAEQFEDLVPIRLDVDYDKIKLRDTFTWNLHDRVVHPVHFAEQLIEDFKVPPEASQVLLHLVTSSINDQIQDFYPHVFIDEGPLDPDLPYYAYKNDEMRILINLDITIGQHTLIDQFEWDLNNPSNSPEEFALQMTTELSLSGEFKTAIAHSIRERCQLFTRSLYITEHPFDGRPIEDADLKAALLPSPITSVFRPQHHTKDFTPYLFEPNETELESAEKSLSREQRRQKRSVNRRGGPMLPDLKEKQRTVRTLLVSSTLLGAADAIEDTRLFKRSVGASGRGRRAAGHKGLDDESEESESEESGPESPAMQNLNSGTARTRGMRGAATAAQAAMRANYGRSTTPELLGLHHHETRTSARRGGRDTRDESVDPNTYIIKLKLKREKYRVWWRNRKAAMKALQQQKDAEALADRSTADQDVYQATPSRTSMGPPTTPGPPNQQLRGLQGPNIVQSGIQSGAGVTTNPPQPSESPPPTPAWLNEGLASLRTKYNRDMFEGTMRYTAINPNTGNAAQQPLPPDVTYQYLPRVRCHDCPGKLYTPGSEQTVENFEVHLKNRQHRERVEKRLRGF